MHSVQGSCSYAEILQIFAEGPIDEPGLMKTQRQAEMDDNVEKRPAMTSADGQLHRCTLFLFQKRMTSQWSTATYTPLCMAREVRRL